MSEPLSRNAINKLRPKKTLACFGRFTASGTEVSCQGRETGGGVVWKTSLDSYLAGGGRGGRSSAVKLIAKKV